MTRKHYEIDGRNFSTLEEFAQEAVNKGLCEKPATRDSEMSDDKEPDEVSPGDHVILVWKNSRLSRENFGREGTIRLLEDRKSKGEQIDIESYKEQLDNGQGKTLYEVLVETVEIMLKLDNEREVEFRFE